MIHVKTTTSVFSKSAFPGTFIVMNNREYNVLKNFTKSQTDCVSAKMGRFIAMDIEDPSVDYLALAEALGVPAKRIDRAADIAPSIEAAIRSGVTNLIEIPIAA
jgi:benzoylformate decarboxylase